MKDRDPKKTRGGIAVDGLAGWVLARLQRGAARLRSVKNVKPRMALVERITLGPRQSVSLVEADGRRFLLAISADGGPAFLALDDRRRMGRTQQARVSW